MFIWNKKHYSKKLELENDTVDEMIKESSPINIPSKEKTIENRNSYSSSYGTSLDTLHSSLIDNYHQTFIRFLCKDTQTIDIVCEQCIIKNNRLIDNITYLDETKKELDKYIIDLDETKKELDKKIKECIDLEMINKDNVKRYENIQLENISITELNIILKEETAILKEENRILKEENRILKFEIDKLNNRVERSYIEDSKKKAISEENNMDYPNNFSNRNDISGYDNEIYQLKKLNNELLDKLKRLNIQDECDFNRAIRSKFPVRFHAVHTDSYYLN
jgi:hypothetical protein